MNTIEQVMAAHVYNRVAAYGKRHPEESSERKKYGAMAHRLPILVRNAGLAEALAFVESRGKEPHKDLLEDLAQVVSNVGKDRYIGDSRSAELQGYVHLMRRTMLALKWFKRFAQSVLEVGPTEEGGTE
jgi:CRISPR-associated protein Cmr5